MASNGLLDQNERLKAAIVAEEREKFQSEKVNTITSVFRRVFQIQNREILNTLPVLFFLLMVDGESFELTPLKRPGLVIEAI